MKIKISQVLSLLWFSLFTFPAQASFIYVSFEQLLAEAELIVTGEIVHKAYVRKESVNNSTIHHPDTGLIEEKSSLEMGVFTDYELRVDEVLKGSVKTDTIDIEESGGCYDGICARGSTDYYYEVGDRVFILLKEKMNRPLYQSSGAGYTAYFLTDDGKIFKHPDQLELINGSGFERTNPPRPTTLEEIKAILDKQLVK